MIEKEMLPGHVEVYNMASSMRGVLKIGKYPYWNDGNYQNVRASQANAIVMMLGHCDTKSHSWVGSDLFKKDFANFSKKMIQSTVD